MGGPMRTTTLSWLSCGLLWLRLTPVSKGTAASWAQRRVSRAKARVSGHYGKSLVDSLINGLYLQPFQEGFFASLMRGDTLSPVTARVPYAMPPFQPLPFKGQPQVKADVTNLQHVDMSVVELRTLAAFTDEDLERVAQVQVIPRERAKRINEDLWLAAMYGSRPGPIGKLTRKDDFVAGQTVYKWEGQT